LRLRLAEKYSQSMSSCAARAARRACGGGNFASLEQLLDPPQTFPDLLLGITAQKRRERPRDGTARDVKLHRYRKLTSAVSGSGVDMQNPAMFETTRKRTPGDVIALFLVSDFNLGIQQ